jgi:Starch-binding associating with outer membrane
MKNILNLFLFPLFGILFVTGCDTTALHELNDNPNAVHPIDMNYFFTSVELGSASNGSLWEWGNRYTDWETNIGICAPAIQQLAYAGAPGDNSMGGDKYLEIGELSNATFQIYYWDVAQNCAEILKQTGPGGFDAGNKVNMRNAARILRVLCFHRLTDWYGSIPYFEANKGFDGILYPKYDKQKDIYADLLKELDEATKAMAERDPSDPDEGFKAADIIYNGDAVKWKKFGYSLMLRLAMRISNVNDVMADTYVTKAVAGGVFLNNEDNVWVPMANGPDPFKNQNSISRVFDPNDGSLNSFLSKTLIDWFMGPDKTSTADDDPRLMIISGGIADWTSESWNVLPGGDDPLNQKGLPNGYDQPMLDALEGHEVNQAHTYSRINLKMLQIDDPYPLMNYAETEFLMAEALERGIGSGITGTTKSHYEAGVKAACQMWTPYDASLTVSDEAVAAYLATYPYGVEKPALEMIGEQLWVSKFMNWWDAWSDWRRTGYPVLIPVDYNGNDTNGQIPRKLVITGAEAAGNPNYAEGATQPDHFIGKVWWDGGPE